VRLTSRQCGPDRPAIGIDYRMNLAGQRASRPSHGLSSIPSDAGTVLMHADNGRVDHLQGDVMSASNP
jgi:hypothetical protein